MRRYGLVLAGGLARRMGGGDKALIRIGSETILARALARLTPQVSGVVLNANGDPVALCAVRIAGRRRQRAGFRRPARRHSGRARLGGGEPAGHRLGRERAGRLPVPAARSGGAAACGARIAENKPLACAHSGDWRHPVVGLWQVALREDLRHAITVEDLRKIEVWTARHGVALADWPTEPVDPFFNVNTPEDVEEGDERARASGWTKAL